MSYRDYQMDLYDQRHRAEYGPCLNRLHISFMLKGTAQQDFNLQFFSSFDPAWVTINGLKYFRFWLRFCWAIWALVSKKSDSPSLGNHPPASHVLADFLLTCRDMIPRGDWLARVIYSGEIDLLGYDTPGRLTRQGIIHRGDWLARVWYPGETDSPGVSYPRGDWLPGVSYPRESDFPT